MIQPATTKAKMKSHLINIALVPPCPLLKVFRPQPKKQPNLEIASMLVFATVAPSRYGPIRSPGPGTDSFAKESRFLQTRRAGVGAG